MMRRIKGAAANRRPAGQSDVGSNFLTTRCSQRALPAAVAEPDRSIKWSEYETTEDSSIIDLGSDSADWMRKAVAIGRALVNHGAIR